MKETSFKAGVIGGVFTFLALFATTSKASINESAATNGDYRINRVQYEFINELTIYKVSGPGIPGIKYVLRDSEKRVDSLIDTYSDEEIVCANRPEA